MQVRDELRVLVEAEVAQAIENFKKLEGSIGHAAGETDKLGDSMDNVGGSAKNSALGVNDLGKALGSLAEVAALAKALDMIKDLGVFALSAADNFQTMKNQFGVLLGDMEAGAGLFNEIKKFNDVTPFDMGTLTQATNVLISAKVPLQDLQAQLTKFGDLSQGNSQKMTSYVNAFSQAAAKGKADMQVLNTYLHQGVPILDALAKNFGVTTDEVVKMSGEGKISFKDFSAALDDLTAAGGRYFGGMELASQSLAAMQEGLKEAVSSLAASFGEMLLPAATGVTGTLTDLTNAINKSPILKGLLTGALVAITGYLGAMAVKATIAFAAQMKLNFAIGALNPVVLASTVAVAAMAAGYAVYSSKAQAAAKESEDFNLALRKKSNALLDAAAAVREYANSFSGMGHEDIARKMRAAEQTVTGLNNAIRENQEEIDRLNDRYREYGQDHFVNNTEDIKKLETLIGRQKDLLEAATAELDALRRGYSEFRREAGAGVDNNRIGWIEKMFGSTQEAKIKQINEQLATANGYLSGSNLSESDRTKLQAIVRGLNEELQRLQNKGEDINRVAAEWKKSWAAFYEKFQAERSGDPFAVIEYERKKKLEDAWNNYIRTGNKETIDQINAYYDAQRGDAIKRIAGEEDRMRRELSKTKIDDIKHELQEALEAINTLEKQRVIAAANSEEEIEAIRKRFAAMREETEQQFKIKIEKTELEEAREAVKNWQEELSDGLLRGIMDLGIFADQASVILSDLTAQLLELSASAALSGFEEFGRALGEGEDAMDSMGRALAAMAQQILKQLPMMFLQAGLQLIANGQWPLGLGFIAAAGSSAIISGYVDGASKHAQGGVFDERGQARMFAAGGMFTNQIVSSPTYFAHGGGLGLMGEAGPEAVMPLARMPDGDLGVKTAGGGANVTVNIINNSGAEVRREETETTDGGMRIDVTIGDAINRHIASGKADRAMGRFGVRAQGV